MSDTYSRQRRELLRNKRRARTKSSAARRAMATDRATAAITYQFEPAPREPDTNTDSLLDDRKDRL